MADWGLYSALRGTDDWGQKRQDSAMNLMVAEKREAIQQQEVAMSAAAETEISKYMEELQNMETLPEDQERVAAAERQARQSIVAGIAKNNGDLKKYMSTGGITALSDYKTAVMGSEEVKQAGVNKVNLTNYLEQEKKGNQRHRLIDVEVPTFDEETGEQTGSKTEKMTFQQQYDLYKKGNIRSLNYSGSEKRIDVGLNDFNRMYKNPSNPYQKDNLVTQSNIYQKYLSKGASKEYAREQADLYADMAETGGDAWRWNAKDPYELQLKQQALELRQKKASNAAANAKKRKLTATATLDSLSTVMSLDGGEVQTLPDGTEIGGKEKIMSGNQKEAMAYQLGFEYIEGEKNIFKAPGQKLMVGDASDPSSKYDLSLFENVRMTNWITKKEKDPWTGEETGNVNRYIEAEVSLLDPSHWAAFVDFGDWKNLPLTESGMFQGTHPKENVKTNWEDIGGGDFRGKILIDVNDILSDEHLVTEINQRINHSANAYTHYVGGSNELRDAKTSDIIEDLINAGYSEEDISRSMGLWNLDPEIEQ